MTRQRLIVLGALGLAAIALAVWLTPDLGRPRVLSGYVEGEALYMAAPVSGTLGALSVRRGDRVEAGAALFALDPAQPAAELAQASASAAAAAAQLSDAQKGQRPAELAILDAQVAAAEARAQEAQVSLRRIAILAEQGVYAPARLDDARATAEAAQAQAAAARRQRDAAALGGRQDQVRAAGFRVSEAQVQVTAAAARLGDLAPRAPAAARVEEVFYQPGEWVPANQPVLALLPDHRVNLRFFVPQAEVAAYRPGRSVAFACDGCPPGLSATITYVSPRPEFTPPVIYSRDARDRLVFMVEARPSVQLNPGQPVDVTPLAPVAGARP